MSLLKRIFRKGSIFRELPILVVVALVVSLVIKTFIVQFFYIPSGSMENTLQIQDRVAVNRVPFISNEINRGDVIVFRDPDNWLPEASADLGTSVTSKLKEALVIVGVLPNPAKQYLVKRVIGIAGDKVICCDSSDALTVNGKSTSEPYIFAGNKASDMKFTITVDPGKVWVMGDHRGASADSRFHQDDINGGMVPLSQVTGRVFAKIWPIKSIGIVHSHDPIG